MFGRATIRLGISPHSSFFNLVDLQFILKLLYDSINIVINADQLWAVGWP